MNGVPFLFMTGLLQRLIMTVSLQKEDVDEFLQKNVTKNRHIGI